MAMARRTDTVHRSPTSATTQHPDSARPPQPGKTLDGTTILTLAAQRSVRHRRSAERKRPFMHEQTIESYASCM